jgi:hypothetical protein
LSPAYKQFVSGTFYAFPEWREFTLRINVIFSGLIMSIGYAGLSALYEN